MEVATQFEPARLHLSVHMTPPADIQRFVCQRFAQEHGAQVAQLLPWQCGLRDGDGRLLASAGLRSAASGPLFLEYYLSAPVEQQLAARLQQPVARHEILEIGNLAAEKGRARWLVLSLIRYLAEQRFRYVVFTATDQVQQLFARVGLAPLYLQEATPDRVPDPQSWGLYYQHTPQVLAGEIRSGWMQLQAMPRMQALLSQLPLGDNDLPGDRGQ